MNPHPQRNLHVVEATDSAPPRMSFVELDRCFVPIAKDQEPSLDIGRMWGRKVAGWLNWPDLHKYRRVVLLAEASSGKTEEFRNQRDQLNGAGKLAFFVRIEELADQGFVATLEPASAKLFQQWRSGGGEATFFLDSVDEARLNRKSFDGALKRLLADIESGLERAQIFISCRVTDWKGNEDRAHIERLLPAPEPAQIVEQEDSDSNPLLDPIFKKKERPDPDKKNEAKHDPGKLLVVQLVPLAAEQRKQLAGAFAVPDIEAFASAIDQNGLDAYAERPGDLLDLADYWKTHRRFGTFAEMVEHSINRKLGEKDPFRPDNDTLPQDKAREGAARLAAALTLGKSFTLRAPGYDPDPSLAVGALDPKEILDGWTDAERNALLRRGVFAPSTYGRIRFHHRSTQEYLAARWFDRLLRANCPRTEVWDRFFAERYGVETVVPSLRAVAAWLSLWQPEFRDEIIGREPLVLLQHGDPGSVPIQAKKKILATYAARHAAADIADDSLDHRALWMFADQSIASAVRAAWEANSRSDFRMDLLRLIREGAVAACSDLARNVALDETAGEHHRVVAVQALAACKDDSGLSSIVRLLVEHPESFSAYLASSYAGVLFPQYLTVGQLAALIEKSQLPEKDTVEGFPYHIVDLYRACLDRNARADLASRLADLCLSPPFAEWHERVSKRFRDLARHIEPIVIMEAQATDADDTPDYLVRLLMVVERAERYVHLDEQKETLRDVILSRVKLRRALFWSDVAEIRAHSKAEQKPVSIWQVFVHGGVLWKLGLADLSWLEQDMQDRGEDDRRIALSALVPLLRQEGRFETETPRLRERVRDCLLLSQDLEGYLVLPVENETSREHRKWAEEHEQKRQKQEARDRKSWENFRADVRSNTEKLRDPACVKIWKAGAYRLGGLTRWLHHRTEGEEEHAIRQWRLLQEGFNREIAEAYRDGMRALWRNMRPERPKRKDGGVITVKRMTVLAFGAIGLETAESPDWASRLSEDEAKRAILHGCLSEQGYPDWIDDLVKAYPHVALPVIKRNVRDEWLTANAVKSDFLYRYARPAAAIQPAIQKILFEIVTGRAEPTDPHKLDRGIRIVKNLQLDEPQRRKLTTLSRKRFAQHASAGRTDFALYYLALLFVISPDSAIPDLESWLAAGQGADGVARAEQAFAFLFDRHDPIVSGLQGRASAVTLEKLLRLVYRYVRPEQDIVHKGVFSPDARDHAEGARDVILTAMINSSGPDAYFALRRIAANPEYHFRAERFRELARGMAERDTEPMAWAAKEVVAFERDHTAPVKTGADLLNLVVSVLQDIQHAMDHNDVTSRPLLKNAKNEDEVRNWLMEQMNSGAKGRFSTFREAEVADNNMPDVIVASTSAPVEVAIEVKHGGKTWTLRQYENALRQQLANDYLKPANRRHGIFVVSNHGARQWRDPETNEVVTFEALIARLSSVAETLTTNDSGAAIVVRAFGLDASEARP